MSSQKEVTQIRTILLTETATLPAKATAGAAAYDVYADLPNGPITLEPGQSELIPTGISFRLPENWEVQCRPRSGIPNKHKVFVPNSPGTIDSDYQGEIFVGLMNLDFAGGVPYVVKHGARIAQLVINKLPETELVVEAYTPPTSERGEGGFGSTGQ